MQQQTALQTFYLNLQTNSHSCGQLILLLAHCSNYTNYTFVWWPCGKSPEKTNGMRREFQRDHLFTCAARSIFTRKSVPLTQNSISLESHKVGKFIVLQPDTIDLVRFQKKKVIFWLFFKERIQAKLERIS